MGTLARARLHTYILYAAKPFAAILHQDWPSELVTWNDRQSSTFGKYISHPSALLATIPRRADQTQIIYRMSSFRLAVDQDPPRAEKAIAPPGSKVERQNSAGIHVLMAGTNEGQRN